MNKFKGFKLGKGKADIRKIGAAVVATMLVVAMVIGLVPSNEAIAAEKVSDYGTETKYTESLGDNASTEYSGRIWTDKSVYDDDVTFEAFGGAKYTVKNDSDFLVGFSTLATSQSVSGQTQAPIDVVFIIDISGSMSNNNSGMDNGKSRIYNTVQAVNTSIDKLMSMNPYSRVAVVAFSGNAQVLLPLDRYTKITTTEWEWISTGRYDGYWKETEVTQDYFSLSHETATNNNVTLYTRAQGTESSISKDTSVSGGTNIQMGFYEGMNVLASETDTTATIDGKEVKRVPSVILLSDGAPTYSSDSTSWWSPSDNHNDGPGSSPYAGNGMKALMVASYMKDAIDRNYKVANTTSKTRVYTVGMGITDLSANEKSLAYMTLDPGTYWETENNTADSTIINSTMASTIRAYWNSYTANNNTGTVDVNVGKQDGNEYEDDYYNLTHPTTDYDVASINDYVDDYYDANSASGVTDVFNDIVNSISISTPEVPTEHDTENPLTSGYITYTDPIGEYMEVKALKSIIYAGNQYTSVDSHREGSNTDYIDTYVFAGSVEGNPVYGTHELKEITIQVHTVITNGIKEQTMTIKVPAAAIPLRVNTVTLNSDGTVKSHTNNGAYPVRVLYTVGLQDEVKSDGHVNLEKLTAEYIEANSNDDGTVNFYSNLYTGTNTVNGKSAGDATVEFEPAHTNAFYYMQENTPIYKDKTCTQIAAAPAELEDETLYYYNETYYHGNTVVTGAIERTGAQLKSVGVVNIDGQWYRPEGSPRLNRVLKFEGTKIDNNTNTAEDFYAPKFVQTGATPYDGKFVIYLGNNGVMSAVASGTLDITKTVTADDGLTAPDKSFTFTVNLKSSGSALTGTYTYKVLDASGNAVVDADGNAVTGTIKDGETLTLKAGQTARIVNLPPNTEYIVTETAVAGFKTTVDNQQKNIVTGIIKAGETPQEIFENHYSVTPLTYPTEGGMQGAKILDGRDWEKTDKFAFAISSTNNAPLPEERTVTVTGQTAEDGEAVLFNFGQITYKAPGTYYYTIVELTPGLADKERLPGVSYTKEAYDVVVTVIDNGDGTLAVDQANTKMTKVLDSTGQKISEVISDNVAVFTNTYSATSVYFGPVAKKNYTDNSGKKPLTDGMFTFEMRPVGENADTAPMPKEGTTGTGTDRVYKATNVGEFISFSQMEFTQDYASKKFTYNLKEVIPSGAVYNDDGTYTLNGMTYDANVITVTVEVALEGAAVKVTPTYMDAEGKELKDKNGASLKSGIFTNVYTPTPVVLGDDTNAPIQGKKTLIGRNMEDNEIFTFTLEAADDTTTKAITDEVITLAKTNATVEKGKAGIAVDFDFGETTFTKPGTYTFDVKETAGKAGGVTYDNHVCTVTVVVKDNDGKLEADVTYDNGAGATDNTEAVFVNTYIPIFDVETAVTLTGKKQLTGQTLLEGEFYFSVEPQGNAPVSLGLDLITSTGDSEADENGVYEGDITFLDNVTYTEAGTYIYLIRETIPEPKRGGMTYDESVYRVKVVVTDDRNGTLSASKPVIELQKTEDGQITYESVDSITFKNSYVPNPVKITPYEMTKVLVGKRMKDGQDYPLQAGEFEFKKTIVSANPADGVILPNPSKITNDAYGKVQFSDITFTKAGTYVIQIREVVPEGAKDNGDGTYTLGAITYDTHVVQSTFKVTDDENGTLTVVRTSTIGSREFRNEYKSEGTLKGETNLKVTKNFTGRSWKEGDSFTFILEGKNEATNTAIAEGKVVLPDKTEITISYDDKDKSKAFGNIVFYEAGTYEFAIREDVPEEPLPGVDYDVTSRTIVVTAVDNGTGKLTVTATGGTNPTFNNVYKPEEVVLYGHGNLHVIKRFTGRENDEWLDSDAFKFTITPKAGVTADEVTAGNIIMPTETLTVNKDNKEYAHFGNITFKEVGEYEFVVTEEVGNIPGVTYTTVSKTVKVNVTNDSEKGVLLVAIADRSDSLEFINTYGTTPATLDGSTYLKVKKALSGRNWREDDEFTFTLGVADVSTEKAVEAGDVVLPSEKELTVNKTETSKAFGDITFKKPGAYAFTIKEVKGDIDGVTYDGHTATVSVMVVDNKEGQLVIAATDVVTTGSMTWTNIYTPDPIQLSLEALKKIDGRDWDATKDIYTFSIVAVGANASKTPLPEKTTVQNATDGKITFEKITYAEAGEYKYVIYENGSNVAGVTTDKGYVVANVTVTNDADKGELVSSVVYTKVNGDTRTENVNEFVNTYSSTGELDGSTYLKVTKKLTGRDWFETDEFEFTLEAADDVTKSEIGKSITMPANKDGITIDGADKDKEAAFGNIIFTEPGTYKFIIQEVIPEETNKIDGITYDSHKVTVEVVVTDNHKGQLVAATPVYSGSMEFENAYTPKNVSAKIMGWKLMDGRELRDSDIFEFTISVNPDSPSNIPMPDKTTVKNNKDGSITFGTITYSEAGTYVYDIKETGGSAPGVTNDPTIVTATVEITYDASTGKLSEPVVTYSIGDNKGFVFKNTYKADPTDPVTIFTAKKTVTPSTGNSYTIKGGEFEFKITPDTEHNPSTDPISEKTVSNDKNGNVIFASDVKYTESGTYYYTVQELDGNLGGMSYDGAVYEITVVVTDNEDTAKLSATATIEKTEDGKTETVNAITFDNRYNPEQTTESIDGKKELTGSKKLEADEFSFTIAEAIDSPEGTPMPAKTTVKNDATGEFRFGPITYTVPGEYSYIISEVNEGKTGYTYDDATYTVTVKVTDDNGKLKAEVSHKEADIVFKNSYEPNPITLKGETALKGTKELAGRTLKADEFTFQLIGEDNKVVLESKNDADGNFAFEPLTFTKEGTYKYTIVETNTGLGGVTYDTNSYAVMVEVTDAKGNLEAKVSYYDDNEKASVVFKNTYVAQPVTQQITATKKLTGRDLKAGEFTFVLKNEAGEVVGTAKNDANGVIIFDGITYDKAGTYKYTISEEKGQTEYVTYDESVYKVTVTVKDGLNGHMEASVEYEGGAVVFTNSYREPVVPTNDTIFSGEYVVTALIALATAVVAFFRRKRIVK